VRAKFVSRARDTAVAPASGHSELKLDEARPLLTTLTRGPSEAKGIIYFVSGFGGKTQAPATFRPLPYVIKTLSENGWDTISARVPAGVEARGVDIVRGGAVYMGRRMRELKTQGYKRVILAGHSWGAWGALLIAPASDFAADTLLLSAPTTFGQATSMNGQPNTLFRMALTEFPRVVARIKTPTVLLLPDDPDWDPDPGKRGVIAVAHFQQATIPSVVIAKPPGFTGHFAAWLPVFDYIYGRCIIAFVENPTPSPCSPSPLSNDDFRSIVDLNQIVDAESRVLTVPTMLVGRKFLAYTLSAHAIQQYEYASVSRRRYASGNGTKGEGYTLAKGLHCVAERCGKLLQWTDGQLLEFEPKSGKTIAWWVEQR
jgi:hypothetical protein